MKAWGGERASFGSANAGGNVKPLVGLGLGGSSFTARDLPTAGARLGEPVWGPSALLRDLELRLGLPPVLEAASVRVPRWATRIQSLANPRAFYAASFAVDSIGTAETLLAWRDTLVEAGWNSDAIPGGGDRLDALVAIERHDLEPLPAGNADRLVCVERELAGGRDRIYDQVTLVEERGVWSHRWQQIFRLLEARGTTLQIVEPDLPGANAGSDLELLQRLLRANATVKTLGMSGAVRGDGSLLLLRGETPTELGELTAAFLAASPAKDALVVRCVDAAPLESALDRHGLALQGHKSPSTWRPAAQILPLAIELAFEPRDPYRVLELLTLPVGPFRGTLGAMLAKAVARQPGIGGQEWLRRKTDAERVLRERHDTFQQTQGKSAADAAKLAEAHATARMQRVTDWLEIPGAGAEGATRVRLLEITARVRAWLQPQAAPDARSPDTYRAAYGQAKAFTEALTNHHADHLSREEAQHLFDSVARSENRHDLFVEQAGRQPHVTHPAAVLAAASTVIFWNFVAGTERRPRAIPWNGAELRALSGAGVHFVEPVRLLAVEADAWRRGVLAARERVVFVVPRSEKGTATAPHPLWDEITARLGIDEDPAAISRITRDVPTLLRTDGGGLAAVTTLCALALPEARAVWKLPPVALAGDDARGTSATALQTLVSCPLAWVLEHRANLRFGAVAKVADGPLLSGNLSHRLVEELFNAGAFDLDEPAFLGSVETTLERLIRTEGATLLLQGAVFERAQLSGQIRRAMRELHRYIRAAGFRIAAVEEPIAMQSTVGNPHGRLDVRLTDKSGKDAVLDLKWGASTYRGLLEKGRAIQLAVYTQALGASANRSSVPPAAYYAISSAKVLTSDPRMKAPRTIDGLSLDETWKHVEKTRAAVLRSLERGDVPVANTRRALPLLEQLGVAEQERDGHYQSERDAPCEYCAFGSLCGRAWEVLQ